MPSYGYRLRVVCLSLSPSSETNPPTASPLVQGYATKTKALARARNPASYAGCAKRDENKIAGKKMPLRDPGSEKHTNRACPSACQAQTRGQNIQVSDQKALFIDNVIF